MWSFCSGTGGQFTPEYTINEAFLKIQELKLIIYKPLTAKNMNLLQTETAFYKKQLQ